MENISHEKFIPPTWKRKSKLCFSLCFLKIADSQLFILFLYFRFSLEMKGNVLSLK